MVDSKKMLKELAAAGCKYSDIDHIFKQKEIGSEAVDIILKWLPRIYKEHFGSGDHLVRSLLSAKEAYDPSVLIELFEWEFLNHVVRWSIGFVLAKSKTFDISEWMKDQLLDKKYSFERSAFIEGLIVKSGIKDRLDLMEILKKIFDKYFNFESYQKLYKKYASIDDVPFLEHKLANPNFTLYIEGSNKTSSIFFNDTAKKLPQKFEKEISRLIKGIREKKKFITSL